MSYNNQINYGQQVPMATTLPVQGSPPQMYQPVPGNYAPQQQPSYGVDQTRFSAPRPIATPTPAAEVGFFDKVKSYFNDVYRSDDNLRAYKTFQTTLETDPNTLKPGSLDRGRVTDLQQKLNIAGVQANVNGVYGYATGEAVKEFKKMMNLNDGFLDGKGQPALTDVATPQLQLVLNSVVSKKLNPQMPGTANPMPVTQEELMWAQNLAAKVQSFGYQPNAQERNRYNEIMARQQAQGQPGMPNLPGPALPNVPIPGLPQQPPPVYQQPPAPYNPSPNPPVQGQQAVTQQELDWAMAMQERIMGGYRPSQQESAMYDNIQRRYAAQPAEPSQPTPAPSGQLRPVTQGELDWAMAMQDKITTQGYRPTPDEAARYTDIFNRYQNQPAQPPAPVTATPTQPVEQPKPTYNPGQTATVEIDNSVSQAELQWAIELQQKIDTQGYKPTQAEITRYTDIFNRYQASQQQPSQPTPTPEQTPTPGQTHGSTPTAPVQPAPGSIGSVGYIVLGYANSRGTMAIWSQAPKDPTGMNGPTGNWGTDKNRLAYLSPDGSSTIAQNDMTNTIAKQLTSQWRLIYTPPGGQQTQPPAPVTGVPTQPTAPVSSQGATAEEVQWARSLEGKVVQGYKPSQQEIQKYNEIQMKLATYGVAASATTTLSSTGPVSQAEIDWAMQIQHKVQFENYQPTQQEVATYTDIFNRYQQQLQAQPTQPQAPVQPQQPVTPPAPQQPVAPAAPPAGTGAPTPEEMQWAQQLQQMVQQGYQATEQEVARYTDIYTRIQQAQGAGVPQQPQQPQQPVYQQTQPAAPPQAPGSVTINVAAADPEMQWALELLNRYRQGYQPSQSELVMYERIIATKAVPGATP